MVLAPPASLPYAGFDVVDFYSFEVAATGRTFVMCDPQLGLLAGVGPTVLVGEP